MEYPANDAVVDAMQRGIDVAVERIQQAYTTPEARSAFAMSVLFWAMGKPPQMVEAAAKLDNALRVADGKAPIDDPLLTLWSGR